MIGPGAGDLFFLILNLLVTESKFDHDSEESVEDEEEMEEEDDEEEEEESPISNAPTEEEYVPDSPPPSPVEPKKELPQYLPALQVNNWGLTVRETVW